MSPRLRMTIDRCASLNAKPQKTERRDTIRFQILFSRFLTRDTARFVVQGIPNAETGQADNLRI